MTELLDSGFIDSFRNFYPDAEGIYSWWSYRFKAREKNAGWRIDYFLVSNDLKEQMKTRPSTRISSVRITVRWNLSWTICCRKEDARRWRARLQGRKR